MEFVHHRAKKLILGFRLQAALLAVRQVLANAGFEIGQALISAQLFREIIIKVRQGPFLDGLDLNVISHGLARQPLLAVVSRVDNLSLQLLTNLGAAQ